MIEIVSPSSRKMDYGRKTALYREARVREYWIVDPDQKTVTVYHFEKDEKPARYSFSERVKVCIYEDLSIDLSHIISFSMKH